MLNVIFAISWARFGNPSVYIMPIVMGIQNFIKIYQKVQGPVSRFSEFEPRQNLDQSQMSFDNILSISMCMQNFITIFFTVQENFSRIWSSAKPRPIKNVRSQSLGLDLVKINVHAKVYQNIPLSSRGPFSLFQNLAISWARSCQCQCLRNSLSKYSTQFKK